MASSLHFKRRSVIFRWLFSYISILIVPVLLSGLVYIRTSVTLREEINRANAALLQQVKNDMDNKLSEMQRLSVQICLNARVRTLLREDDLFLSAQDYNAMIQDFRVYRLANSSVQNFYIFLQNRQAILTPDTMMVGSIHKKFLENQFTLLDDTPLKRILWNRKEQGFFPISECQYGSQKKRRIAYLQSLPLDRATAPNASLLIVLDSAQLTKTLSNMNWVYSGVVLVLDAQDNILASSQNDFALPDALRYANLTNEEKLFSYSDEAGNQYTVAHLTSSVTDLKYVSILPDTIFWKAANDVRQLTLLAVLASLLLGGALAWLFARHNYLPVRELVNELASRADTEVVQGQSEFAFMRSAIHAALGARHAVDEVKDRQLIHLRRSFVARLLKDRLDPAIPVQEALNLYDLHFAGDRFCVLLFFIHRIDGNVLKGAKQDEYTLARYIIRNVFEELFNREHLAMMTTVDDLQALLINVQDAQTFEAQCKEAVETGTQFVQQRFGIVLSLACSSMAEGLDAISTAYAEAYTTIEYSILMGSTGLTQSRQLTYGLGGATNSYYYYYPLKVEVQLTNHIKSGDYSQAKSILTMLLDRNFHQHTPPQSIVKCFMFNLTSTMVKTTYEIAGAHGDELPAVNQSIERLLTCAAVPEMEMELDYILIRLCEYTLGKGKAYDFTRAAYAFISEHYGDAGLGVAQVAAHLGITPSYLSKRFRQTYGESVLKVIGKVRIEAVKRLLTDTDKPLYEIAEQCGFVNSNTLIRTFKKSEGITPGRYREVNRLPIETL